ncbi:MAG: MBL fold metallo-hydrolase, partial [Gemmatimonadales bacterium]|nr:MBL fold metallo-hydrolase [Gemmatimonadales bacterium]
MPNFICTTCGTQYPEAVLPPEDCVICTEERQYVGWKGQRWITLEELRATHRNRLETEGHGLVGIGTEPGFAIGQRALHFTTPSGGILWDSISLVDDATVAAVHALGGVRAMAISHPHFYASMIEWSLALGGVPIYLNAADREWVMRDDAAIRYWEGDSLEIAPGVTLIHCPGHFAGSSVLHWAAGADGLGALLTGDSIMVALDRRTVSFMYSYPNLIPLSASAVTRIVAALEPFEFERIYGGWFGKNVL